jgi:hypothetical protein
VRVQSILSGMLLGAALASPARAGTPFPLGAPVTAVAAGPTRLLAATASDLLLLDLQGRVLRRLPLQEPAPGHGRPAATDDPFAIGAGVSSADDFDEAYDSDLDLEDAENVTGRWARSAKRVVTRAAPSTPPVVAVDERFAWWGREDGLWRMELNGQGATRVLRTTGIGVQALATSPDGKYVIVHSDGTVHRSVDGGANFSRLFVIGGGGADVSVTSSGTAFVLESSGLRRVRVDATASEPLASATAEAIASCGAVTLAIAAGRVLVLDDAHSELAFAPGDALPAGMTRVACSKDGAVWAALGATLWAAFRSLRRR